jgi:alcohol dehydrogenase (cytochrome c)
MRGKLLCAILALFSATAVVAQVSGERLLNAQNEPQNWLMYSGSYSGQRYSTLSQITPANAKDLEVKWVFQADSVQKLESTPLVVNGVLYLTQPPDDIIALDGKTGRVFWIYHYPVASDARLCCGLVNRGLAILGNTLFSFGTCRSETITPVTESPRLRWW